ncbi:MAG: glycoside hydrolase family 3 C-terminal domain-containing protein [Bacteroidales bacterium]|nr:glycoside hydrolase family 3 C-terminal domain-containing protein [Bacteroidales bacterium]
MKYVTCILVGGLVALSGNCRETASESTMVDSLMSVMTLEERIGQTNFGVVGTPLVVGSAVGLEEAIAQGLIGSVGGHDPQGAYNAQKTAVERSPHGIPLIIGLDVVHGYRTTFPIPLGAASSWNLPLVEKAARMAAREASSFGICHTYAPMVDICRDPRWGRIAEGTGEDPWLGSRMAEAQIRGYQGAHLAADSTVMACVKHFALYGASEGGRDYNTVSMDDATMHNYYLPPYHAGVHAGAGTVMSSFNVVNGVPATSNSWLLTTLLRDQWGFDGFVISDANSVAETLTHGTTSGAIDAAVQALLAGTDMDLCSGLYSACLKDALEQGLITEDDINRACRRVLLAKVRLGLFDDPYRYFHDAPAPYEALTVAQKLAAESAVLLKNDGVLPLKSNAKVAVVGDMADARGDLRGCWAWNYDEQLLRSPREALDSVIGLVSPEQADVVLCITGEPASLTGEAKCRADISLPENGKRAVEHAKSYGRPVVAVLLTGRPLVIPELEADPQISAILVGWHGGTRASQALADVLTGVVNPSGRLTSTWPRHNGQIPLYYNALPTGRPYSDFWATSKYLDVSNEALYPFGYGLGYSTVEYSPISLSAKEIVGEKKEAEAYVTVTNTGNVPQTEVVQLYLRDPVADISRPVKELKGFQRVELQPGENRRVTFTITPELLTYYDPATGQWRWDDGEFVLMVGPNSRDLCCDTITWRHTNASAETQALRRHIHEELPKSVRTLSEDTAGRFGLRYPYSVPCVRDGFQDMYYWDTYFTNLGLLIDGDTEQALNNYRDIISLIDRFGYMPNGSNEALVDRSQPPVAALMARDLLAYGVDTMSVIATLPALEREYQFWMTQRIAPNGLNRYGHNSSDDTLDGFYGAITTYRFLQQPDPSLTREQRVAAGAHLLAEAESGWDFNPRFHHCCMDFNPVDLNALMYASELTLADLCYLAGRQADIQKYRNSANKRQKLFNRYCVDPKTHIPYDYDWRNSKRGTLLSSAIFFPLYTGLVDKATAKAVSQALDRLELPYGLPACEKGVRDVTYQWDYPNCWAPLLVMAVGGLEKYGNSTEAKRLAQKYLDTVTRMYRESGQLWEKYNGETGNHDAADEYANIGNFMGWTAGAWLYCYNYLYQ